MRNRPEVLLAMGLLSASWAACPASPVRGEQVEPRSPQQNQQDQALHSKSGQPRATPSDGPIRAGARHDINVRYAEAKYKFAKAQLDVSLDATKRAPGAVQPQVQPLAQHVGNRLGHDFADPPRVVAGAEVRGDDQLVVEPVARSTMSSRCMWPNLWILSLRCDGATKVISMISTWASYIAGQLSSPSGALSPR